ncbi:MAG TPA: sugar isomerase domain-containing protein [Candidatus Limnocylindrales bacterium]|nr:sugar isomerase domain-containing protein [Candidatus Limnocylindrales bacterium]
MTAADRYLDGAIAALAQIASGQRDAVEAAATRVADAIGDGHRVFVAATSHVLHTELVLRAGGLAALHPLGEPPDLGDPMLALSAGELTGDGSFTPGPGDVVLVGTNAGTDAGTVEVAVAARRAGCLVVALTSVAYETWPDVVREHPSGRRLVDEADLVVDIGGVVGDGIVELPGLDTAVGPTSGVALAATAWAIVARAAELLVERGLPPIVYRSVQIPGAEALFRARRAAYEATGIGYVSDDGLGKSSSTRTGRARRSDS